MVGESRGRTKDDGRNRGDEESRLEEDRRLYRAQKESVQAWVASRS